MAKRLEDFVARNNVFHSAPFFREQKISRMQVASRERLPITGTTLAMKLRALTVFLGGYLTTVVVLARLYHSFSGIGSIADIAICLAIALLIGFAAGTSETAARHAVSFVLASFCGALTILLSFYLSMAVVALPYVFFWTNAAWVGLQAARICRTTLSATKNTART